VTWPPATGGGADPEHRAARADRPEHGVLPDVVRHWFAQLPGRPDAGQAFNDEERTTAHQDTLWWLLFNGNPLRLYYYAQPYFQQEPMNAELDVYVQDSWTIGNLTLTGGIRTDYVTMGFPAAQLGAGPSVGARTVPELRGVPDWTDVNPRGGVSYDLTSDGRTAVKVSMGRFNELTRSRLTREFQPFNSSVSTANRLWIDANQNWIVDCDTANLTPNGECGAISNANYGQFPDLQPEDYIFGNLEGCSEASPEACPSTMFDPDVLYDNRPHTFGTSWPRSSASCLPDCRSAAGTTGTGRAASGCRTTC